MRPLLAALAAVAAATTTGGAPAPTTHVERRSIHHKHTPCNPTPHTVEQAPMPPRGCRNAEATSRGPTWPSPSAGPSRRWQEPSTARKGAPSPSPAALHPHRAESSGAKSNHGPTSMLRSPRQPHTQIRAAAPTAAPQRPTQRSSATLGRQSAGGGAHNATEWGRIPESVGNANEPYSDGRCALPHHCDALEVRT